MPSRLRWKSAATSTRANRLSPGTPPTVTRCGPSAFCIATSVASGFGPIVFCVLRNACRRAMPSGVGSIEHFMPPARAASMARSATIRSSKWTSGRPLVAPTTVPPASTVGVSAGPARTMSCASVSTNTCVIRSRPPRNRTSGGSGRPSAAAWMAATTRASDTFRNGAAPVPIVASARARRRSCASDSDALASRARTMPSASIAIPPTAPPKPKPPPKPWAAAGSHRAQATPITAPAIATTIIRRQRGPGRPTLRRRTSGTARWGDDADGVWRNMGILSRDGPKRAVWRLHGDGRTAGSRGC